MRCSFCGAENIRTMEGVGFFLSLDSCDRCETRRQELSEAYMTWFRAMTDRAGGDRWRGQWCDTLRAINRRLMRRECLITDFTLHEVAEVAR